MRVHRSVPEVHQLDTHPVRVGAIEEIERGVAEGERSAGSSDHGASERLDRGGHRPDILYSKREMREAQLIHGSALG